MLKLIYKNNTKQRNKQKTLVTITLFWKRPNLRNTALVPCLQDCCFYQNSSQNSVKQPNLSVSAVNVVALILLSNSEWHDLKKWKDTDEGIRYGKRIWFSNCTYHYYHSLHIMSVMIFCMYSLETVPHSRSILSKMQGRCKSPSVIHSHLCAV